MAEAILPVEKEDIVVTGERRVVCDGPVLGKHPRVYLTMVDDADGRPDNVVCPYCSRVFTYNPTLAKAGDHH